jgi:peroxiredoxin/glutaredoxin
MNVELYSKPNCSLCDQARSVLLEVQKRIPFELLEVDIEKDPVLLERYRHDIPVVFVDGKAWFKHKVDASELEKRLERARAFNMGTLDPQKTLSRTAPVSRATKVGFALTVLLAIAAVFASKGYSKLVLDPERAIEGLDLIKQNRPAPDFALQDADGKSLALSSYRGKVLVLNFYATWCEPCREEVPSLNDLAKTLASDPHVQVLAVSVQEDWPTIHKFFGAQPPSFALALDQSSMAARAYEQKDNLQFPETFIIAPDGKVMAKIEGPRDWTEPAMLHYLHKLAAIPVASAGS